MLYQQQKFIKNLLSFLKYWVFASKNVNSKQIQSFHGNKKVQFRTHYYSENFYGSLLELDLCMKDCLGPCTMFSVSQD